MPSTAFSIPFLLWKKAPAEQTKGNNMDAQHSIRNLLAGLLALGTTIAAGNDGVKIEPVERWSGVFAESKVTFHYAIGADEPLQGVAGWRFSINRRTVSRGEATVKAKPGKPAEVVIPLEIPPVKEGVIVGATLEVTVSGQGAEAEHARPLWIFPRDPFVDRSRWLKDLKITLFDPKGKTAELFEKAKIPFKFTRNMASLDGLGEGLIVIGEGISLKDHRGLGKTILDAAASGVPVLCLAPVDGRLPMPGATLPKQPQPRRVSFRRQDVIRELDKRIDSVAWPPDGRLIASRFAMAADRDWVVAEATSTGEGWPWIEVQYAQERGKLLLCGFDIVRQWDAGPAPRFLLARLFERLANEKPPSTKPKED